MTNDLILILAMTVSGAALAVYLGWSDRHHPQWRERAERRRADRRFARNHTTPRPLR